jgi:hypothetical protein
MHYKNGREAKNGDHVITKGYGGQVVSGVIFNLIATTSACNCNVAVVKPGGTYDLTCQDVGEMFYAEDGFNALEPKPENVIALPTAA